MITKYGEVTISKDDNGEDSILITNFSFDGSDIQGSSMNSLKIAALIWAKQAIDTSLPKLLEHESLQTINDKLYKIVEDTEA